MFGHIGITLGAAVLFSRTLSGIRSTETSKSEAAEPSSPSSSAALTSSCEASWLDSLTTRLDIRLLLIGSLLPDIIDKPVGQFLFRETFNNGRIFSHTLLFLVLITMAGLYFYRRQSQTWLLSLSLGSFTHLVFDQIWRIPQTLFWPLYGFAFPKADISDWMPNMLYALFTEPRVYVPELLGAIMLIWFAWTLLHRRKMSAFIRYGRTQ